MHELAITESVVAAVAERVGPARVLRVRLEIGKLSRVVPASVRFCFDVCTRGTALAGARLEVVETPGRARCRDCGDDVELETLVGLCACGGTDLELLEGQQLKIREVEVV